MIRVSRFCVLAGALLLAACGFRLQGAEGYPESMATTYLDASDRYTVFYHELSSALETGGVELVDSAIDASAVIRIESDVSGRSVLTVSGRNVPTEYDVYYEVKYSVWMAGQQVLPSHSIALSQDYTYDETLVLGKNREADTIRVALAKEVVRQVSQELSRLQ